VDNRELEAAFAKVGRVCYSFLLDCCAHADLFFQVQKASVVFDPHTRESRGFAFVTMETPEEADAAITALNATDLMGRVLTVTKVRILVGALCLLSGTYFAFSLRRPRGVAQGPQRQANITVLKNEAIVCSCRHFSILAYSYLFFSLIRQRTSI